jgi:hypothetical protein
MPGHRSRGRAALPFTPTPDPERRASSPALHPNTGPGAEGGGGWPMHATAQPWHAEGRPSPTGRTAETAGDSTLANPDHQSLGRPGFNVQILLLPPALCKEMPWSKDCWAYAKRRPFTEPSMLLCPTSADSNLRLLTAREKPKSFSQTFSHPSLRAYETHCSASSSAEQSRSFPS